MLRPGQRLGLQRDSPELGPATRSFAPHLTKAATLKLIATRTIGGLKNAIYSAEPERQGESRQRSARNRNSLLPVAGAIPLRLERRILLSAHQQRRWFTECNWMQTKH